MGNVLVREETLTEIADSIREKNGLFDKYKPAEMPEAIRNIQTGGKRTREDDPVRFYGLEGELLYSYTLEEVMELTEIPPLPSCEGLICQGWNWSLENIKDYQEAVNVGALFMTDDGATRLYVSVRESMLDPYVGFGQSAADSVKVDWGDGSALETSKDTGSSTTAWLRHHYEKAGDYVIKLIPDDGALLTISGSTAGTYLFRGSTATAKEINAPYYAALRKIEVGRNVNLSSYALLASGLEEVTIPEGTTSILYQAAKGDAKLKTVTLPRSITTTGQEGFSNCSSLELLIVSDELKGFNSKSLRYCPNLHYVTIPKSVVSIAEYAMANCTGLKKVLLPSGITFMSSNICNGCSTLKELTIDVEEDTLGDSLFYGCLALGKIVVPEGIRSLGVQTFCHCDTAMEVVLPDSLETIGNSAFRMCGALTEITIPKNVTSIGALAFDSCYGIRDYYLMPEIPPVLGSDSALEIYLEDCRIHVPKGCLEAYRSAEYWSTYADYMVEMEE